MKQYKVDNIDNFAYYGKIQLWHFYCSVINVAVLSISGYA